MNLENTTATAENLEIAQDFQNVESLATEQTTEQPPTETVEPIAPPPPPPPPPPKSTNTPPTRREKIQPIQSSNTGEKIAAPVKGKQTEAEFAPTENSSLSSDLMAATAFLVIDSALSMGMAWISGEKRDRFLLSKDAATQTKKSLAAAIEYSNIKFTPYTGLIITLGACYIPLFVIAFQIRNEKKKLQQLNDQIQNDSNQREANLQQQEEQTQTQTPAQFVKAEAEKASPQELYNKMIVCLPDPAKDSPDRASWEKKTAQEIRATHEIMTDRANFKTTNDKVLTGANGDFYLTTYDNTRIKKHDHPKTSHSKPSNFIAQRIKTLKANGYTEEQINKFLQIYKKRLRDIFSITQADTNEYRKKNF